ncbi:hypothetical protein [Mucilaginibacter rubeus]|uniref:Uncharacterized protein n=1 Tax=Mucilaginibacter rubeus TaxID=2027860 RepID=A0A5C1HX29_9SPHI|nr:hypothetical protein [Mucilaginibacter rubeus]QEM10185.1 hypothetical protein DEO27_009160 [Mucilaginibacter rubeus]
MPQITIGTTLYNTQSLTELITYKFPILPVVGDMIEVINQRTMFVVNSRSFHPHYETGLIELTLYGVFENGEDIRLHTFDKIKIAIRDEKQRLSNMDWSTENRTLPSSLD